MTVFWVLISLITIGYLIMIWSNRLDLIPIKESISDWAGYTFGYLLIAVVFFCFIFFFGGLFVSQKYGKIQESHRTIKTIISLRSENNISGSFFLGTGNIKNVDSYIFFVKREDGSFYRSSYPVDRSFIYEVDYRGPSIEYVYYERLRPKWWGWEHKYSCTSSAIFYVPKGTIIKEFKLQ